jgi:hypothetical protein
MESTGSPTTMRTTVPLSRTDPVQVVGPCLINNLINFTELVWIDYCGSNKFHSPRFMLLVFFIFYSPWLFPTLLWYSFPVICSEFSGQWSPPRRVCCCPTRDYLTVADTKALFLNRQQMYSAAKILTVLLMDEWTIKTPNPTLKRALTSCVTKLKWAPARFN